MSKTKLHSYMTLKETAVFLRCSERSLKRYIKNGRVPFTRFGRRYLFRPEELVGNPASCRPAKASIEEILL
jgi:excisionase family DNA binding protein